jgi:hypothetical protein
MNSGRGDFLAVFDRPEPLAVETLADRQNATQQFQGRVVVQVPAPCPAAHHILMPVRIRNSAEHIQDPVELGQQPAAHQDHHGAQHDGADDADHQHPLLVVRGHREVGEDHQEHKDVVDRQRLLDQVAGQELQ